MDIAGLIFDDSKHYLDHLAPFCAQRNWPLILCEPSLASLARLYYPGLQIMEIPWRDLHLPKKVVSCHPRPLLQAAFPFADVQTFWLPHGYSDKGWKTAVFEYLKHEETVFVYGSKMRGLIQEKSHLHIETVGNFRKTYYQQHRAFYRELIETKIPRQKETFLYAPTWDDFEDNSSFWKALPILADHLPDQTTLLVKPHPNTITAFAPQLERLIGRYEKKKNIIWLLDFPLIYPLLEIADGYIGDMSSIGYDYLSFNRPMYFLKPNLDKTLGLSSCGLELAPSEYKELFSLHKSTQLKDKPRFQKARQQVYRATFSQATLLVTC